LRTRGPRLLYAPKLARRAPRFAKMYFCAHTVVS
jgi:hypothetical protein